MQPPLEKRKALIVVRTYPTPARTGVEVSCTAAVTETGEWMRLFPIPYRFLDNDQRFRKYQWVEVTIRKARDKRPESYKLEPGSPIRILSEPLSTSHEWKDRKRFVLSLRAHCMCCLQEQRDAKGFPTLGLFRPKLIKRLVIKAESPSWTASQLGILRQTRLFEPGPAKELEKIPYSFHYEFECDHAGCSGHNMTCTDWEMGESWRKWKEKYGNNWESKFRQRYEIEMIDKNDTHFYVGTIHQYPASWIIVGLFYPPRPETSDVGSLFDLS